MRILLLEDDREIGRFIVDGLRKKKFAVDWAETGERGLVWAKVNDYDAAIFDVKLAGKKDGLAVCRELRAYGKQFPILVLSVAGDVIGKVEALNLGADDYLTKPFSFMELLARVQALMRREKKVIGPRLTVGDLELDVKDHTVKRAGKSIDLSRKEFALLEYLMRNPGATLTRNMIFEHVWDMNADPFTNTVDVHIKFLRTKIDEKQKKKLIKTVHGHGYKIEA